MFADDYLGPDAIPDDEAEWEVETSPGKWVLWVGREKPKVDYFKVSSITGRPSYYGIRPHGPKSRPCNPLGR